METTLFPHHANMRPSSPLVRNDEADPQQPGAAKRPRARKIRAPLGPFATTATTFDHGERVIEIVRLTPAAIVYRLVGHAQEYVLPHATACLKAISLTAGIDTGPRAGSIQRGGVR